MSSPAIAPRVLVRGVLALAVGLAFAAHPAFRALTGRTKFADFNQIWLAAYALVHRAEPYQFVEQHFAWPLFYPLTAAIVGLPFTPLRLEVAAVVWVAISFGVLAFALTRTSWWPLIALASYPAVHAMRYAQWSPLLTASALLPSLVWLAVAKPTSGLAIVAAYTPRTLERWRFTAVVMISVVALSFALSPTWPLAWRQALAENQHLIPMLARPGGVFVLLALLKWRRPEARLLVFLATVPATAAPYELLPIVALVPRSRAEMLTLALCSYVVVPYLTAGGGGTAAGFAHGIAHDAPFLLATTYLPALVMVLRRPNVA